MQSLITAGAVPLRLLSAARKKYRPGTAGPRLRPEDLHAQLALAPFCPSLLQPLPRLKGTAKVARLAAVPAEYLLPPVASEPPVPSADGSRWKSPRSPPEPVPREGPEPAKAAPALPPSTPQTPPSRPCVCVGVFSSALPCISSFSFFSLPLLLPQPAINFLSLGHCLPLRRLVSLSDWPRRPPTSPPSFSLPARIERPRAKSVVPPRRSSGSGSSLSDRWS